MKGKPMKQQLDDMLANLRKMSTEDMYQYLQHKADRARTEKLVKDILSSPRRRARERKEKF